MCASCIIRKQYWGQENIFCWCLKPWCAHHILSRGSNFCAYLKVELVPLAQGRYRGGLLSVQGCGIAASCAVASFKRFDLEGGRLRWAAGSRFTKSWAGGRVNAKLLLTETLQYQDTWWNWLGISLRQMKEESVYIAGSEFMQLAARGCFGNRLSRQVQNRVRRVHGQQRECEGSAPQDMGYWFSLNSTFSALLEMDCGLDEPSVWPSWVFLTFLTSQA